MAARNPGGEERAKGGTTQEFELCVALTTQKYDWLMLGALTTCCQHSRYLWRLAGMCGTGANRSGTRANRNIGIALRKPWCSCESANRLWKNLNLSSVLFSKVFRLQPDCERVSDFAAQQQRPSQRIWAWPFCRPLIWKIEPDFHLKPDIYLKLSAAIGKHFTAVGWSPMSNTPGVSNRTKSNQNPIELNRTIGVRLGSAIEQNRTSILLWVWFSNQSNKIEPIRCNFVQTISLDTGK